MTSATARTPLFFGSDLQDTFRRGVIDPFRSLGVALRARSHRVPAQRPATPHRGRHVKDVAAQRLRVDWRDSVQVEGFSQGESRAVEHRRRSTAETCRW
ncbi:hypothetical protein L842_3819 [Mycobacterium intracellulare MIN_052511_1280]|nr:hypothetical protein L842_3819 [Mycobacterium intracellulare MIN_052511_1280]